MSNNKPNNLRLLRIWDNDNETFDYLDFSNLENLASILSEMSDYFSNNYLTEPDYKTGNTLISRTTGLPDKNGNIIFEDDLVEMPSGQVYWVSYNSLRAAFEFVNMERDSFIPFWDIFSTPDRNKVEIVGNIFRNQFNKEPLES